MQVWTHMAWHIMNAVSRSRQWFGGSVRFSSGLSFLNHFELGFVWLDPCLTSSTQLSIYYLYNFQLRERERERARDNTLTLSQKLRERELRKVSNPYYVSKTERGGGGKNTISKEKHWTRKKLVTTLAQLDLR